MTTLPTTTEHLRGLRCARLLRESSRGQRDKTGPAVQRAMQDEAIERLGLIDSDVERLILNSAWSGRSGDKEPPALSSDAMRALIECGEPVLLVGYGSRFMRSPTDAGNLIRELHRRGTVVYIADGELLSTRDHGAIIDKVLTGWNYSNDLSRTMTRANRVRWIEQGIPVGLPPFGFNRDWSHHPENAQVVRNLFSDYDGNRGSTQVIADRYELDVEQVKVILRNPAYKAVARFNGEERPASFAAIVDPDVWDRVAGRRASRRWASGGRRTAQPSILRGRLTCQCGRRLRLNGANGQKRRRLRHLPPLCPAWGPHEHKPAQPIADVIMAAIRGIQLSPAVIDDAVQLMIASLSGPPRDEVADRRRAKQRRELAAAYEAGTLDDASFLAGSAALRSQKTAPGVSAQRQWSPDAIASLRADLTLMLGNIGTLLDALERTDGDQAAQWVTASAWAFEAFEYHGDQDLRYRLSHAAEAQLLSVALPKVVTVGGEGLEPPTFSV